MRNQNNLREIAPLLKVKRSSDTLNKRGYNFFKKITNDFLDKDTDRPIIIASVHVYEESLPMIQAISNIGDVVALIPKNSTAKRYPEILDALKKKLLTIQDDLGKCFFMNSVGVVNFLKEVVPEGRRFTIMDHGGYFAPSAYEICDAFSKDQCVGFTEFTDNGHKRYEKYSDIDRTILSVAHSPVKIVADKEAAESIVHAVDHILREKFGMKVNNPNQLQFGVIGYGRIGSNTAKQLRKRGVGNIKTTDINYTALANAPNEGFEVATMENICQTCDVIISATGAGALRPQHYRMLKDGAILATVTSPDDELNIDFLLKNGIIVPVEKSDYVTQYIVSKTGNKLFLIGDGESANTMFSAGTGNATLFLPQAAQIVATIKLNEHSDKFVPGIQNLPYHYENEVARMWLEYFHNYG